MKKTLAALAVLGAFAGTSMAADVTLYGRIDTGVFYSNADTYTEKAATFKEDKTLKEDGSQTYGEAKKASMEAGWSTGSRWGLKGAEDLGNGMKVGFVLESGFSGDDGAFGDSTRLFNREATLNVGGDFGTFYFGRMNTLTSDGGSMALAGNMSAIGNAMGVLSMKNSTGSTYGRYDNLIGYVSPNFGGFQVSAQYSMGQKGEDENKATSNRFAAIGAKYAAGPLTLVAMADYSIWGHKAGVDVDNGVTAQVGGNYDFGVAQVFAKAAYFDNMKASGVLEKTFYTLTKDIVYSKLGTESDGKDIYGAAEDLVKGYGVELGTKVPVLGGTAFGAVSYRETKFADDGDDKLKRFGVGVGYSYAFSKRTNVYTSIGYAQEKDDETKLKAYQGGVGLVHKF